MNAVATGIKSLLGVDLDKTGGNLASWNLIHNDNTQRIAQYMCLLNPRSTNLVSCFQGLGTSAGLGKMMSVALLRCNPGPLRRRNEPFIVHPNPDDSFTHFLQLIAVLTCDRPRENGCISE